MTPRCIDAVNAAAKAGGRPELTERQIADIDARLRRTMRQLASREPTWQTLTPDQRLLAAAQQAMKDIAAEAQRKVTNAQLQILKTAATAARLESILSLYDGISHSEATVRDMENVDRAIKGLSGESFSRLMDLLDAVNSKHGTSLGRRAAMMLFDAENPQMTKDLAALLSG